MKSYIAEKKAAEVKSVRAIHFQKKKNASADHAGSGEKRGLAESGRSDKVSVSMKDQRAPPPMNVVASTCI